MNLCFGTDSLGSNETLSIFDEMVAFRSEHPTLPAREIVAMEWLADVLVGLRSSLLLPPPAKRR